MQSLKKTLSQTLFVIFSLLSLSVISVGAMKVESLINTEKERVQRFVRSVQIFASTNLDANAYVTNKDEKEFNPATQAIWGADFKGSLNDLIQIYKKQTSTERSRKGITPFATLKKDLLEARDKFLLTEKAQIDEKAPINLQNIIACIMLRHRYWNPIEAFLFSEDYKQSTLWKKFLTLFIKQKGATLSKEKIKEIYQELSTSPSKQIKKASTIQNLDSFYPDTQEKNAETFLVKIEGLFNYLWPIQTISLKPFNQAIQKNIHAHLEDFCIPTNADGWKCSPALITIFERIKTNSELLADARSNPTYKKQLDEAKQKLINLEKFVYNTNEQSEVAVAFIKKYIWEPINEFANKTKKEIEEKKQEQEQEQKELQQSLFSEGLESEIKKIERRAKKQLEDKMRIETIQKQENIKKLEENIKSLEEEQKVLIINKETLGKEILNLETSKKNLEDKNKICEENPKFFTIQSNTYKKDVANIKKNIDDLKEKRKEIEKPIFWRSGINKKKELSENQEALDEAQKTLKLKESLQNRLLETQIENENNIKANKISIAKIEKDLTDKKKPLSELEEKIKTKTIEVEKKKTDLNNLLGEEEKEKKRLKEEELKRKEKELEEKKRIEEEKLEPKEKHIESEKIKAEGGKSIEEKKTEHKENIEKESELKKQEQETKRLDAIVKPLVDAFYKKDEKNLGVLPIYRALVNGAAMMTANKFKELFERETNIKIDKNIAKTVADLLKKIDVLIKIFETIRKNKSDFQTIEQVYFKEMILQTAEESKNAWKNLLAKTFDEKINDWQDRLTNMSKFFRLMVATMIGKPSKGLKIELPFWLGGSLTVGFIIGLIATKDNQVVVGSKTDTVAIYNDLQKLLDEKCTNKKDAKYKIFADTLKNAFEEPFKK